jgi:hypothetical protein
MAMWSQLTERHGLEGANLWVYHELRFPRDWEDFRIRGDMSLRKLWDYGLILRTDGVLDFTERVKARDFWNDPEPLKDTQPTGKWAESPELRTPPARARSLDVGTIRETDRKHGRCLVSENELRKTLEAWYPQSEPFVGGVVDGLDLFPNGGIVPGTEYWLERVSPRDAQQGRTYMFSSANDSQRAEMFAAIQAIRDVQMHTTDERPSGKARIIDISGSDLKLQGDVRTRLELIGRKIPIAPTGHGYLEAATPEQETQLRKNMPLSYCIEGAVDSTRTVPIGHGEQAQYTEKYSGVIVAQGDGWVVQALTTGERAAVMHRWEELSRPVKPGESVVIDYGRIPAQVAKLERDGQSR